MPFYIRVTSLRTPVYCITQTEGPGDRWQILVHSQEFIGGVIRRCRGERTLQDRRSHYGAQRNCRPVQRIVGSP